jgi:hypothetical protein
MSIYGPEQESLLDACIKLFAIGEHIQACRLNNMASGIVTLLGAASDSRQQEFEEAVKRRIGEASRLTNRNDRTKQLMRVSRTLFVLGLLGEASIAEQRNLTIVSKLKAALQHLAESPPKFTERAELAPHVKAIEYLTSAHDLAIR